MSESSEPRPLRSALAQAGILQEGYRSASLAFREIESISAVRLRTLPGPASGGREADDLPPETGQCAGGDPAALCLRPGEWLVVSETLPTAELLAQVRGRHDEPRFFAWDESDGLAVVRLEGAAAPWLLAKHCGVDFEAGSYAGTHCWQTRFAHIGLLIHRYAGRAGRTFDLYLDRSLAPYLWNLLVDSAPHAEESQARHETRSGLKN